MGGNVVRYCDLHLISTVQIHRGQIHMPNCYYILMTTCTYVVDLDTLEMKVFII